MQEQMTNQAFEVGGRALSLSIKTAEMTLDILKKMILGSQDGRGKSGKIPSVKRGKQSVKQLLGQGQGVENIEINTDNIGLFASSARKFGVDFAMTKDKSTDPPTHTVFFKGKDASAITSAFKDFVNKEEKKIAKDESRVAKGKQRSLVKEIKKIRKELVPKDLTPTRGEMAKEMRKAKKGHQLDR